MKRTVVIGTLIFLSVFFTGCDRYVQLQRMQWDDHSIRFVYDYDFSDQFRSDILFVLMKSDEEYYIDHDGTIYINGRLWFNKIKLAYYCYLADDEAYVPFQRVQYNYDTEEFEYDNDFSEHFQENIIYIAKRHGFPTRIENGILYIPRVLWWEKEGMLWNLCNFASTDEWIAWDKGIFEENLPEEHENTEQQN